MNKLNLLLVLLLVGIAAAAKCGKSYGKCPDGYCCSKFGFCGKNDVYCGKGCQSEFGTCNGKKTVTIVKTSIKAKQAKPTEESKLADTIVNVVDAILDEDTDNGNKNEVVEEVIDALAAEIDDIDKDSDPEEDTGNDGDEVVEEKDGNDEAEEIDDIDKDSDPEEDTGNDGDEVVEEKDGNDDEAEEINKSDEEVEEEEEEGGEEDPTKEKDPNNISSEGEGDEEEGGEEEDPTKEKDPNDISSEGEGEEEEEEETVFVTEYITNTITTSELETIYEEETEPSDPNDEKETNNTEKATPEVTPEPEEPEEPEEPKEPKPEESDEPKPEESEANDETDDEPNGEKDNNNDTISEEETDQGNPEEGKDNNNDTISEEETDQGNPEEGKDNNNDTISEEETDQGNPEEGKDNNTDTITEEETDQGNPEEGKDNNTDTATEEETEQGNPEEEKDNNSDTVTEEETEQGNPEEEKDPDDQNETSSAVVSSENEVTEEETPVNDKDTDTSSSSPTTTTTTTTTKAPEPSSSDECTTEVFGGAHPYNAFFFGDFTGYSSDVQGRLAVKGKADISGGYQNGGFIYDPVKHNSQTNLDCTDSKMSADNKYTIVAGTLDFRDGGEIINGGIAYQNGFNVPGYIKEAIERHKCPIEKKSVIDFDKEKKHLVDLSNKLGNAEQNAKTTNEWGKLIIDLSPGQKNYVITIDNINQYWDIKINENGVNIDDINIIFNLTTEEVTFSNFDISGLNRYATRIIWNAPKAKKILIQNFRIQGSLLAPNADIEGYNGNIQGQMIANSFKGNLQIDWVPFYGCL